MNGKEFADRTEICFLNGRIMGYSIKKSKIHFFDHEIGSIFISPIYSAYIDKERRVNFFKDIKSLRGVSVKISLFREEVEKKEYFLEIQMVEDIARTLRKEEPKYFLKKYGCFELISGTC